MAEVELEARRKFNDSESTKTHKCIQFFLCFILYIFWWSLCICSPLYSTMVCVCCVRVEILLLLVVVIVVVVVVIFEGIKKATCRTTIARANYTPATRVTFAIYHLFSLLFILSLFRMNSCRYCKC